MSKSSNSSNENKKEIAMFTKELNAKDKALYSENPFHLAIVEGRLETVKNIIKERKVDIYNVGPDGKNALQIAFDYKQLEIVRYLIDENYFDINDAICTTQFINGLKELHNAVDAMIKEVVNIHEILNSDLIKETFPLFLYLIEKLKTDISMLSRSYILKGLDDSIFISTELQLDIRDALKQKALLFFEKLTLSDMDEGYCIYEVKEIILSGQHEDLSV